MPALEPAIVGRLDVESIRADFPILHQTVYGGKPLTYLDSAATSQTPRPVIQALTDYYEKTNANVHRALHYLGEQATAQYEGARAKMARWIGAPAPQNVIFTRGTTESINLVARSWSEAHLRPGDEILVTAMEHHSNLVPWQLACARHGATLQMVPITASGELDLDAFAELLSDRTRMVAVTHMSNVLGTINPVADLCDQAHRVGATVLVDAAQSVPHMAVNVQELKADFVAFSAHKMCGPTGVGVLYAAPDALAGLPPFLGGGEMILRVGDTESSWAELPYKYEAGTPNIADVIALGAAVDYLDGIGMARIHECEQQLTAYLIERLDELCGVRVFGRAPRRGGAVSFEVDGIHPHDLSQYVDQQGVAIRAGHLCAQPLMRRLGVPAVSRASLYLYNTPAEIDRLLQAIVAARKFFLP